MMHTTSPAMNPVRRRGVVAVVVQGDRFLVIRRSTTVAAPGMFCFPGGGIEPQETEVTALVREFQEELSAELRPVRRIWRCQTAWQVDLAWWLGEVDSEATLAPHPAEVESMHWLSAAELGQLDNLLESNQAFLQHLAAGTIRLYGTANRGAEFTAGVPPRRD
jgi:8-oxo-dGTP diphosphatase